MSSCPTKSIIRDGSFTRYLNTNIEENYKLFWLTDSNCPAELSINHAILEVKSYPNF